MWLYSHLVVAEQVEPYLALDDLDAYYLGATVPDIRHWVEMKRAQTHISPEDVVTYLARYPHLRSFALGYLVHCISEHSMSQLGLHEAILCRFPLSLLRRRLPARFITALVEWYYYETLPRQYRVAQSGNEMLRDLGVDDDAVAEFARDVNAFLRDPSPTAMLSMLEDAVAGHPRYREYVRVPSLLERYPILKRLLFALSRGPITTFNDRVGPYLVSLPPLARYHQRRIGESQ
jgi:hypothetical protein